MYSNYGSNERAKHAFSFSGCLSRENSLPTCEYVRERNSRDLVSKATGKGPVSYLCFSLVEAGVEVEGVLCQRVETGRVCGVLLSVLGSTGRKGNGAEGKPFSSIVRDNNPCYAMYTGTMYKSL